VTIAAKASNRTTVVEVNAGDRPGLLASLTGAIRDCGLTVHSAHIATYGERAVDVFYLTRSDGRKLDEADVARLRPALVAAAFAASSLREQAGS
jgi:[protein-PII] uridylyltransferase